MDDKAVTVTGCLQESSASTTGAPSSAKFILANATTGSGSTSTASTATPPTTATAGTTGTTGTAPSTATATSTTRTYSLDGSDTDLQKHVGHKVEVTGTIDATSKSESSASTSTAAGTSTSRTTAVDQKLKVSSVRMIAADCTSK